MKILATLLACLIFAGCGATPWMSRVYIVKSGIVTYLSTAGLEHTYYFDDYGRKEAHVTKSQDDVLYQVFADDVAYSFSEKSNLGAKNKLSDMPEANRNIFEYLLDDVTKNPEYKEIGEVVILGKKSKGISFVKATAKLGTGSPKTEYFEVWHHQNIPLAIISADSKADVAKGNVVILKATKVELDVPVPGEKFSIPADVAITAPK